MIAAALLGVASQLGSTVGFYDQLDPGGWSLPVPIWGAIVLGLIGLGVSAAVLSVLGYLVTNGGFRLSHGDGSWHVSRGLLTTRETSLDDERVAGVSIGQPLGLRWARGARLTAIVTGLRETQGGSHLVPARAARRRRPGGGRRPRHRGPGRRRPSRPRTGSPAAALRARARAGADRPRARARRWLADWVPGWVPVAAALLVVAALGLAADRARALGHDLVDGYVVARSGSLTRAREVLAADHVIGWNLRATWWQRRVGLTSLVATTAGGQQSVTVVDVPDELAVALATAANPELVTQFHA